MILQKLKLIAVAFVVSGLFLTGAGVLARQQATRSREVLGPDGRKIQREPSRKIQSEPTRPHSFGTSDGLPRRPRSQARHGHGTSAISIGS